MGLLVEGNWADRWYDTKSSGGRFVRQDSAFRGWVRADGSTKHRPEAGRYHLYVSLACPWAHRTLIFRKLKKLEGAISVNVVDPYMREQGWIFGNTPGATPDELFASQYLYEVYQRAKPDYTGRVTVPVLWDKELGMIVSNESSEIIRMFNSEFDAIGEASLDFYPAELRDEIDAMNEFVYPRINNGVYRCGFATTQEAYDEAFRDLFSALDTLEDRLSKQTLSRRRPHHGGRLAPFHHARALRSGVRRPLQVQSAPNRRLSEPLGLPSRALPGAGDRGYRRT